VLRSAVIATTLLTSLACSDRTPTREPSKPSDTAGRTASTQGGSIVLSRDEKIAVAVNRSAGVITILRLDPTKGPSELVQPLPVLLDTGQTAEPWSAVIGADDDTAYVAVRKRGLVVEVTGLHGPSPTVARSVQVGSEPTAIAISPSGAYLFVANWGDGTVSAIRTDEFVELSVRFDLNTKLAESGVLGNVTARPGLAHPRALAMTDDGDIDDRDEVLYVTEFFSQPIANVQAASDGSHVDHSRQGLVYTIPVSSVGFDDSPVFTIAPVQDTGFPDGAGVSTGCLPNQLYAAALDGQRLVVTSMCASPRGPVGPKTATGEATNQNFKTVVHPVLFSVDPDRGQQTLPALVLTRELDALYPIDDTTARMPLIPNDIAFERSARENGLKSAYLTAFGADAVFRVEFDGEGAFRGIGSETARYIDVRSRGGTLPTGVALSTLASKPFALVLNDNSQNVIVIDRSTDEIAASHPTTDQSDGSRAWQQLRSAENHGRRLFATGLDAWSLQGKAFSSCESCHPDGLSDGITWFFTRGPRRTISTAATYDGENPQNRRLLLWTANVDEIHDVEVITRTVSGGVGGVLWRYSTPPAGDCRILYDGTCSSMTAEGACLLTGAGVEPCPAPKHTSTLRNGLNGSLAEVVTGSSCDSAGEACDESSVEDWNDIDAYIRSLGAPKGPRRGNRPFSEVTPADVDRGVELFRIGRCAACHGGPGWTISKLFYEPGGAQNGALPYVAPESGVFDVLGDLRTTTYSVESELLRGLNPLANNDTHTAPLRTFTPADPSDGAAKTFAYSNPAEDQINCVLRSVGTFPPQPTPDTANPMPNPVKEGITAPGAPVVLEVRQDMATLALGATGFNVPSLLGLAAGAPYFHAGNARTLEEVFDPVFSAHHRAIVPDFLDDSSQRTDDVRALVSFLLSMDEETPVEPVPTDLRFDPVLCPH
jgi:DNA-binding beta-propeller fold protein YncE